MIEILTFQKGDIICQEGKYELWMYEIQSGEVAVYKEYGLPGQKLLGSGITKGFIGEMGLLNSMQRYATVVATEETKLIKIDSAAFNQYYTEHPEKVGMLMVCISRRLNQVNEEYLEVCNTIRDYLELQEKNIEKSSRLENAMKKFSAVFRRRSK